MRLYPPAPVMTRVVAEDIAGKPLGRILAKPLWRARALEPELLPQERVDDLRVGFAARRFQHLTDEPAEHGGLGLHGRHLVRVGGDHRSDGLVDDASVGDLPQTPLRHDLGGIAAFAPGDLEHVLGDLAGDGARGDEIDDGAKLAGRYGRLIDRHPLPVEAPEQLVDHPVGGDLAIAPLCHGLEEVRALPLGHQDPGIVGGELELAHEARLLGVGQLRQIPLQARDVVLGQLERQEVGVGEVTVVVRLLLGAHGARGALGGVEEPRLLLDHATVLDDVDLASGFGLDRLANEADGIDVLDLATGSEPLFAGPPHRYIHVGAQVALLHVAVAGAEIAQDRAQLRQERLRLPGRAQVGLGHDLHQRHAGAIEVNVGMLRVLVVEQFAGVLLQVQALDADPHGLPVHVHLDRTFPDDRPFVLRYLIALRQIRIEVVLAVEHRDKVDFGVEPEPGADGLGDAGLVDDGQHARHGRVNERDVGVGLAAELRRGTREQLCLGGHLRVHLHADHHFPFARGAFDERALFRQLVVLHAWHPLPNQWGHRPWVGPRTSPGQAGAGLDRPTDFGQYRPS